MFCGSGGGVLQAKAIFGGESAKKGARSGFSACSGFSLWFLEAGVSVWFRAETSRGKEKPQRGPQKPQPRRSRGWGFGGPSCGFDVRGRFLSKPHRNTQPGFFWRGKGGPAGAAGGNGGKWETRVEWVTRVETRKLLYPNTWPTDGMGAIGTAVPY